MSVGRYQIHAGADLLDVRWRGPAKFRVFGGFLIACGLAEAYFTSAPRGGGPGIWMLLARSHPGSSDFYPNLVGGLLALAVAAFALAVGIRYCLQFAETLRCDRTTLTWSRIPWVSFGNRWITRSIPLAEVVGASYAVVYRSKGIYGIVLETYDENWKAFWQIEPPEANRILAGLRRLGVKVHHDSQMRLLIRESLRDRREQL